MGLRHFTLQAFFLFCFLARGELYASAQSDFNTRLWQAEDGLPNNIVQAITQTSDQCLWVGTREGLVWFDGNQFHLVDLLSQSTQPAVNCLCAGKDGCLWVGTERDGIFCLDKGVIIRCDLPGGDDNFGVNQIVESGDGTVWFETSRGILHSLKDKGGPLAQFETGEPKICGDNNGGIWALENGLRRVDISKATNYVLHSGAFPVSARSLYCDTNNIFWIGPDYGPQDAFIKVEGGVATNFRRGVGPAGFVSVVLRDTSGDLWVGSYAGLSRFLNGKFVNFYGAGEPSYRIYSIFEDKEQNIWVGSEEGLTRISKKRFKTITKANGLSMNIVVSVYPSDDGGVWIGTWGGGLNHYLNGNISYLNKSNGLASDYIMGITETRDGSLWVGVDYDGPLHRIKNGKITIYGPQQGFLTGVATVAFYESKNGTLWIGTRDGLLTWNGTSFNRYTTKDGLSHDFINALCGGVDDDVWIGTGGGLTRWHDGKFENYADKDARFHVVILSLYRDSQNVLWIGTKWHGLLRLKNGVLDEYTRSSGLFSDSIYAIVEDNHTNLWLNSSRGIFRVNKGQIENFAQGKESSIASINYGKADGIVSSGQYTDVTQPAACKDSQGRLWFRTTQGVVVVDPETVAVNHQPPSVTIQEIRFDGKTVFLNRFGGKIPPQIVIPPGRGDLEIRYVAFSYSAPEKNSFRYRMKGLDNDWVNAENNRVATYNNLSPGHYRFQVIACNDDQVWNNEGQSLNLILKPHYWQTWWFFFLYSVSAIVIIVASVRHWTRLRMQRKLMQLEQRHAVERERARIARDVHDELGSKLTQISFQGSIAQCGLNDPVETKRQIEQMSASAREAVSSLQEIIWAADPENDSLEGLIGHISHYAGEFFNASAISCEVSAPEYIPDHQISAAARHNLFLAVKEAVNNAAKHAQAKRILITMIVREAELEIVISDDGGGFEAASSAGDGHDKTRRMGYGLSNMRERLATIGGRSEIISEAGRGTVVRFIIPLSADGV
ncbi:MAG TPA: two-component regulator propeller domain-containing protein [Verrucomicrobiae bacterium]